MAEEKKARRCEICAGAEQNGTKLICKCPYSDLYLDHVDQNMSCPRFHTLSTDYNVPAR